MQIYYTSRERASKIEPTPNMALISVYEVAEEEKNMKTAIEKGDVAEVDLSKWAHSVRVQFWDIDRAFEEDGISYLPMSREDACRILDMIETLPVEIDTIVVHCFAGVSRSAAIAKFLMDHVYNMPEESKRVSQAYNRYVYSTLLNEWYDRKERSCGEKD